jgi:hypothetical protein
MNIQQIKQKLSTVDLISEYPFINSYGISTKTNKETLKDEYVVEFAVSKKISLDYISEKYILPKSLSAFGIDIPTIVTEDKSASFNHVSEDGEEIKYYELVGHNLSACDDYNELLEDYNVYLDYINSGGTPISALSAEIQYSYHPLNENIEPIKTNRSKHRPLSGGCSSIYYPGGTDATLGIIVRDKQDKKIVALSNAHVYANSLLVGEEAKRFGKLDNALNLSARQPGDFAFNKYGDPLTPSVDHIGKPKRTGKLSGIVRNKIDACIVDLSSYDGFINSGSKDILWFTQKGPYEFATTEEIESLMDPDSDNYQSPMFRSGRTLGPLGVPGNAYPVKRTITQSATAIHSLTESLTSKSGINLRTLGVSSLYLNWNQYYGGQSMGALIYTDATETSAFSIGHTGYYNRTSNTSEPGNDNLFFLKDHTNFDLDLAIVDPTGIKNIIINYANFGSFYLSKSNKVYYNHYPPGHGPGSLSFRINQSSYAHYADQPGFADRKDEFVNIKNSQTDWIELSTVSGTFNKPIKKSFLSKDIGLLLTEDNQLWAMGGNLILTADNYGNEFIFGTDIASYVTGLSTEFNDYVALSGSMGRFHQIKGDYIDFGFENSYPAGSPTWGHQIVYGLSATGGLLHAAYVIRNPESTSLTYKSFFDYPDVNISKPPQLVLNSNLGLWSISGSHDLSYSRLILSGDADIKIKKIFTTSDKNGEIKSNKETNLALQTVDNRILMIPHPYKFETYKTYGTTMQYLKYNNNDVIVDDNDPPKFLDNNIRYYRENNTYGTFFLSGGSYYATGHHFINFFTSYNFLKNLGSGTNYDINSIYPMVDLNVKKWDNFPPNNFTNMVGEFGYYSRDNDTTDQLYTVPSRYGAQFVYTDGIGISALGQNSLSNQFIKAETSESLSNEIIQATSVDTIAAVNFGLPNGSLIFNDTIKFRNITGNGAATAGGDSGTALFACLSSTSTTLSTFKCIGLLFAGPEPSNTSFGLGCRIDHIKDQLNIEPWDGVI